MQYYIACVAFGRCAPRKGTAGRERIRCAKLLGPAAGEQRCCQPNGEKKMLGSKGGRGSAGSAQEGRRLVRTGAARGACGARRPGARGKGSAQRMAFRLLLLRSRSRGSIGTLRSCGQGGRAGGRGRRGFKRSRIGSVGGRGTK